MEAINTCCCCLLRPFDKNLKTPYVHLGVTEIFSNMLKECFQINLTLNNDDECGICEECVGRLRDASDFKLQVQRSQAELRARIGRALQVENVEPTIKTERPDDDAMSDTPAPELETPIAIEVKKPKEEHPCDTCGEAFPNKPSLLEHMQEHTPTTYNCEKCPLTFTRAFDFSMHMAVHNFRGRYSCDVCDMQFKNKGARYFHRCVPSGEHTCVICKKKFTLKANLNEHMKTHKEPNSCEASNQITLKSSLAQKTILHAAVKTFSCNICGKSFKQKNEFIQHKRIHGEGPYSCNVCQRQFKQKNELNVHVRIHTGQKPYFCQFCDLPERWCSCDAWPRRGTFFPWR